MPVEYVSVMASGGLSSTPEDLCRYSSVLYRNRLFSEDSLSEYTRAQYGPEIALCDAPWFNCGLGWDSVEGASQNSIFAALNSCHNC